MKLSNASWNILQTGLVIRASYPSCGVGSHPRTLLRLPVYARDAVQAIWDESDEPVADVYTFSDGDTREPTFVIIKRSTGKAFIERELCYPENIGHILAVCLRRAQVRSHYSLWQWISNAVTGEYKFVYFVMALLGAIFFGFGIALVWTSIGPNAPPPSRSFGILFGLAIVLMSAGCFGYPALEAWWDRYKLRRALRQVRT